MNRAFGTGLVALVLAGRGGSDPPAGALARSPMTYWHYRDPAWWGLDPHIRIAHRQTSYARSRARA
jgi:hypothetical protein